MKVHNFLSLILAGLLCVSLSFANTTNEDSGGKVFTVVLDAGHGGHDPGNLGNGFKEKDIALNIVLKIGKMLEQNPSIKVVYTRKTDVFVDLKERGNIANKAKADLFISVHCNSHGSSAHGTETWVLGLNGNKYNMEVAKKENSVIYLEEDYELNYAGYDINSPESLIGLTMMQEEYLDQSILLADAIQDNFENRLKRKNRGVKQNIFVVLLQTYMPSVLVETGFLTYRPEGQYLNSAQGQNEMAQAVSQAVFTYKNMVEGFVGDDFSYEVSAEEGSVPQVSEETATRELLSDPDHEVVFKVQIAASSRELELEPFNFNGLNELSMEKAGDLYRYFYGASHSWEEAQELQRTAAAKGFPSCFIVAYKNGEKMDLETAVNSLAN
ncbi:N-acetylmuramoyl-L-alanine amidase [Robertkochia marina]|uniref:N-acetylmuramoyl-L-alanine amidase n=1 Tax=Robertkochia marina TaxID=1227945 RepID=A0A4V6RRS7_9FLAO|nr:N-acetylmuramoyl-L-alanine amidase [Robertkochia marina]THD66754.1 N-acetylmuramoyl-L-alanine amidase [Robertkochia marina]TRZ42356.1 N-acetylmuramoyl-L-alanine amidase [Robertkochia marina]